MRDTVGKIEQEEFNEVDPVVEHMERIGDYLDRIRGEILEECERKLMSRGIEHSNYKPEGYQLARAVVSVVLIEKGRGIFNALPAKTRKDARNLMLF